MTAEALDASSLHRIVAPILRADPIWAAYALADLRADFAPFCRWSVSADRKGDESGLALLYTGLEPPILLTVGTAAGVAEALAQAALPDRVFLSVREEHLPAVQQHFPHVEPRQMLRMVLPQEAEPPPAQQPVVRLGPADAERLKALYRHGGPFTPDYFAAYQLADGYFCAIEDETGALAAAGGTHIVHAGEGVAAIGNVYTRPDCRGRGYGSAITAGIVQALRTDGYELIVLNVNRGNEAARRLYRKFGFVQHCSFIEGIAVSSVEYLVTD